MMRPDGTDSQQLTFGQRKDLEPVVSPDGRYLVFVSYTNEQPHLWKIDRRNSNLTQLTWGAYEDLPRFSPDSKSVIYHSIDDDKYNLRKIPVEGGESVVLTSQPSTQPDISPNGKLVACFSRAQPENSTWAITLFSVVGGPMLKTLSIPASVNPEWPGIRWTPDGSAIIYVATSGGVSNLWLKPVNGGPTRQLTQFTDGQIFAFDQSIPSGLIVCVRGTVKRELLVLKQPN
jgi:Tol biopolymer transport system component